MIKSGRNPQLDKDLIKYLVKSVQRKPYSSTLDSLLKYTMRLDDKVCTYMGHTKNDLKNFLNMFTNELYVDDTERVFLVGKDGAPQYGDAKPNNVEKLEKVERPQPDKPISQATGSIYRILGKYGFIELHPPHSGKVYFDGRHVEDGRHMFLIDYGYKEGMKVQIDAIPGPENAEATYRAKHVRCLSSSEYSSDSNPLKSEPVNVIVDKVGKLAQVFDQYGFISRTANKIDDVFFFMNTIVMPEGKQITCPLTDTLSPGMEAKFDARPNHRQDSQNSWYATRVWIAGVSDQEDTITDSVQNSNGLIDTLEELNDQDIYVSDEDESSEYNNQDELPPLLSGEKGYLNAIDDYRGIIIFGKNCKYKALYVSEVVRVDGRKVEDQAWRFEGGHDVSFNAQMMEVKNKYGVCEKKAIATAVWIGLEPTLDLSLNELYLIYSERHNFILYDPFLLNNIQTNTDVTKPKNAPEMDLLDEFIAGNYPRGFEEDPADTFGVQGIASNGFLPHNGSNDQWPHMPPPISSSPPYSANHQLYALGFDGWTSLLGPNSDEMNCWKNTPIEKSMATLNLVNSSSQTMKMTMYESDTELPPMSSVMSQTTKPIISHDSTQTNRTRTKEKLCSTADLVNFKSIACQTDIRVLASTSSACQTNVSIDWDTMDDDVRWVQVEENRKLADANKEVSVQLCPRCHDLFKS